MHDLITRKLCILGSTGSIGVNTLDVIRAHPDQFKVTALTAGRQIERLAEQCLEFKPKIAVVHSAADAKTLQELLEGKGLSIAVHHGEAGLMSAVTESECDTVMAAIVGAAGLLPTLRAAELGKRVLLANKESLVMSGDIFMNAAIQGGAELLPIDSEHNAIFQCLPPHFTNPKHTIRMKERLGVEEIWLTASGGPFRNTPIDQLANITPDQACAHPNWVMGRKISVDSATMMNKGLEVIEAHWLFGLPLEQIKVLIHPESVVHSMVRYRDGSVMAQLGQPDMRTPIAFGLAWPNRIDAGVAPLDLTQLSGLHFTEPDLQRFPCLGLAFAAAKQGGTSPTVLNAANEIAVAAFLENRLPYLKIAQAVEFALNQLPGQKAGSLDEVLAVDREARLRTSDWIARQ
ncbi:MAG: 1-deoxy-D-xylulose-5-phosphate reductoisomerase [Burkholderiaceae bacterium]|jgi:1-deoxy-D-xylulose-5-phosphate reductoisomerase|nr:1-deoxy-D-xylulose-5-phosphate reductoisomerase [Burkholderiaceae bacterium]NCX25934.1 1-deoxy-D-xylulose-5-phosphate reductoisomerase [Burkholderiaceae bacterium]NCY04545.1 1-deoxy-D-xylulose-5-phosphate reductoisomerase [Burkholderiaceae bacterium]NDC32624.1 1-deoxy-D-xylulose-5-phosphate reductoisomerase [Burkholderiaceae bacterium]